MIAGILAQGARHERRPNAISYVSSSGPAVSATSGASNPITINMPTVSEGDLMIAAVMHRGVVTPPPGWLLIGTASCMSGTLEQFTSLYKKTASSSDSGTSTSWARAGAWSLNISISAYRGSSQTPAVLGFATASRDSVTSNAQSAPMAEVTATADNQMGVCAASSVTSYTTGAFVIYSGTGFTMNPASPPSDGRIAQARKPLMVGEQTTGQFQNNTASTQQNGWACISVLIG